MGKTPKKPRNPDVLIALHERAGDELMNQTRLLYYGFYVFLVFLGTTFYVTAALKDPIAIMIMSAIASVVSWIMFLAIACCRRSRDEAVAYGKSLEDESIHLGAEYRIDFQKEWNRRREGYWIKRRSIARWMERFAFAISIIFVVILVCTAIANFTPFLPPSMLRIWP